MNTLSLDNLTGTSIGQYTLQERLGTGGMSVVYSAFQHNLQRTVAVKLLPPTLALQEGYHERFTREAQTAASLEHAHIVPVYDYGAEGNLSYVVMRLLTGGTLAERIRMMDGMLPSPGEVLHFLNQIASALSYAHSQGVVHRDIKPGNIMFDNQGNAFLVDFGLAKLLDEASLTNSGLAIGTPTHMSPEQWRGEAITSASDQYALAIVIYELITGHLPFESSTVFALLNKHLNEVPTPLPVLRPDVPETVAAVLDQALAKQPEGRYPTVQDFASAFEQAVKGAEGQPTNMFTIVFKRESIPAGLDTPSTKTNPEELELIKRTVEKRIKRSRVIVGFIVHVMSYLIITGVLVAIFGSQWWTNILLVGWGIGVAMHGIEIFYAEDARTRRYEQELARELARHGYDPSLAAQIELNVSSDPSGSRHKH